MLIPREETIQKEKNEKVPNLTQNPRKIFD